MANRNIQAKMLKQKRRGRFARFTGATAKYAVRVDTGRFDADGKAVHIPIGKISLSNAVMSTGRGPNAERMQAYYARVSSQSFLEDIPETKGILPGKQEIDERYDAIVKGFEIHSVVLVKNDFGKLSLVYSGKEWMFVDIDYRKQVIKRSRVYGSKAFALGRLTNKMVAWVEVISLSKIT